MKGDWVVISILIVAYAFMTAALGADAVTWLLNTLAIWLRAWPPPDEHFASMIGDLAWPLTALLIVWLFRRPLRRAAYLLSERMKNDNLKIAGFIEVSRTEFNTMDRRFAVDHQQAAPEVAQDVDHAESLLEYAGRSDRHAQRLLDWIMVTQGSMMDPEAFLLEPAFAEARHQAYVELIEGNPE